MRIQKNRCVASLKTPLFQYLRATVRRNRTDYVIPFIPPNEIDRLLAQDSRPGHTARISITPGDPFVTVYPVTDRRYDIKIVGTTIIEQ